MDKFIPNKQAFLTPDWFMMVINHYRDTKQLSPIR